MAILASTFVPWRCDFCSSEKNIGNIVKSLGKTSKWSTTRSSELSMATSLTAKNMQSAIHNEGEGRKNLEEVLGEEITQQYLVQGASSAVKSEFPVLAEIEKVVEFIETSHLIHHLIKNFAVILIALIVQKIMIVNV